ncbi:MAG: DUF7249 family protein [Nocardioides sp.]
MHDERYQGWTNRETWAVALHINNDERWQESVHEELREAQAQHGLRDEILISREAGEIIRENVEAVLEPVDGEGFEVHLTAGQFSATRDIGSLWRVDWTELGASFLDDIEDESWAASWNER